MRFRLLLSLLPLLVGACAKTDAPVRLDFVGSTGLTSGNRTVNASDTLTTRAYAVGNTEADLQHLRITVTYDPGLTPIIYPTPVSNFDPKNAPGPQEIVYLDSLITPDPRASVRNPSEYLFQNQFTARTTSGTETWQYTITDQQGQLASRAYRLTVRNRDSAAVFHRYNMLLRPVPRAATVAASVRAKSRVFLNLHYGLLLPKYAVLNRQPVLTANQQLIDLVATTDGAAINLSTLADVQVIPSNSSIWPNANVRHTTLRATNLGTTGFNNAANATDFATAFNGGIRFAPDSTRTGTLAKGQTLAFRFTETNTANPPVTTTYYGLLQVTDIIPGSAPLLNCAVKVQK